MPVIFQHVYEIPRVLNVNIQICYDFNKSLIESDYYVLDTEKVTDNCPGHKFGIFKLSRRVVISDPSFSNYKKPWFRRNRWVQHP